MKKYQLGVIGTGFMAKAILQGILQNNLISADNIIVYDINLQQMEQLKKEGVAIANSCLEVANKAEYLLFAIKPQNFNAVAAEMQNCTCTKIISIMAGVSIAKIQSAFVEKKTIARAMPNLPVSISAGMTAIELAGFTENDKNFILQIFSSIGKVIAIEESKIDAVSGISGSGPAYVFLFIKALAEAGVKQGLTLQESKTLAIQTVLGAALMVEKNFNSALSDLIGAVCSKGGTTIEAIESFMQDGFEETVDHAVAACVHRAKELSNT